MVTIRNLLVKHLDSGTEPDSAFRTFILGPLKYASAIDAAAVNDSFLLTIKRRANGQTQSQVVVYHR